MIWSSLQLFAQWFLTSSAPKSLCHLWGAFVNSYVKGTEQRIKWWCEMFGLSKLNLSEKEETWEDIKCLICRDPKKCSLQISNTSCCCLKGSKALSHQVHGCPCKRTRRENVEASGLYMIHFFPDDIPDSDNQESIQASIYAVRACMTGPN